MAKLKGKGKKKGAKKEKKVEVEQTLKEVLMEVTGLKPKKGEVNGSFAERCYTWFLASDDEDEDDNISEEEYDALDVEVREWVEGSQEMFDKGKGTLPIEKADETEEEEVEDPDEEEDEEEVEEKPKAKKKGKGKKGKAKAEKEEVEEKPKAKKGKAKAEKKEVKKGKAKKTKKKPAVTNFIINMVCDDQSLSHDDIMKVVEKKGFKCSSGTVDMCRRLTVRIISVLKERGDL